MKLETSVELLERVRARHSVSWYRLQRMVPTSESTMANWKNGRSSIDRRFVTRIAELLDEPPEYVLACVENERTDSAEVRKLWARIAAKFRVHAASILLGLLVLPSVGAPGIQGVWGPLRELLRAHCILWQIGRGARRRLQFAL